MGDTVTTDACRLLAQIIVPRLAHGALRCVIAETAGSAVTLPRVDVPARYFRPLHTHDYFEVCWVVYGRCAIRLGDRVVAMDPGAYCVVRPDEPHQLRPTPQLDRFLTLWWSERDGQLKMACIGLSPRSRRYTPASVNLDLPLGQYMRQVVDELRASRPYCDVAVRAVMLELSVHALRASIEAGSSDAAPPLNETERPSADAAWHVSRVLEYVEQDHGAGLTLRRLAGVVGLTPTYLTTLFRRHTGRPAMAHVNDVRHREALSLLQQTDLDIAEVAHLAGYQDPYYFSRVFKRRLGHSPQHYRSLFRRLVPSLPEA
jgi:AraC-like DNA-binding protein/mannose-6-phosphate isomerase-like protein (cupin superfamily)